jgi:choline/glycine/proline betaine transport protein
VSSSNVVLRDRNGKVLLDFNRNVFVATSVLIALFVGFSLVYLQAFSATVDELQAWIANQTGWFLVLTVNIILGYLLYLLVSPFGDIRLGGPDARPEFSRFAWLAMLFSAGMGIGLMFYSVAEPIYHLVEPPHGAQPGTQAAYQDAIKTTFLHWGLHAWGIYALTGLCLAYFAFNRGHALSIRSVFSPLLGHRTQGWMGDSIDTLASVATLFGVATSLGLGAQQVNAGLSQLLGLPVGAGTQIVLICGITGLATISVLLGLDRGIKRLSIVNIVFAASLLLFILIIGPTLFILNGFVENLGLYLDDLLALSFWNETYTQGSWQNGWTVFYWGWWIAWAPFVGMFVARVSKGRTIRDFIGGALIASSLMTFVWLSVFGDSALFIELMGPGGLAEAVEDDLARSLFVFLELLPVASELDVPSLLMTCAGGLATVAIVTFFVTSSDSGSLVIDIITAGGKPNPPAAQRVYWALLEGVVAAVLLVGGGLAALQTAAISAGLPFAVLILIMIFCLHRALASDKQAANGVATRK